MSVEEYFVEYSPSSGTPSYWHRSVSGQNAKKISRQEYDKAMMRPGSNKWAIVRKHDPIEMEYYQSGGKRGEIRVTAEEFFPQGDSPYVVARLIQLFLAHQQQGGPVAVGQMYQLPSGIVAQVSDYYIPIARGNIERKKCIDYSLGVETVFGHVPRERSFNACLGQDCDYVLQVRELEPDEPLEKRKGIMERLVACIPEVKDSWACAMDPDTPGGKSMTRHYILFKSKDLRSFKDMTSKISENEAERKLRCLFDFLHLSHISLGLAFLGPEDFVWDKKGNLLLWNLSHVMIHDQVVEKSSTLYLVKQPEEERSPSYRFWLDYCAMSTMIQAIKKPEDFGNHFKALYDKEEDEHRKSQQEFNDRQKAAKAAVMKP